jgi:SNF2 family DNA or RNA helicase
MALEQSGFGVMLPAWWTRKGTKTKLALHANVKSPKMQGGGGGLSLENVVQFDWELALGNKKLTLRELKALAQLKSPLVRIRGQWVEMSASEIQAAIDFWKKNASGQATLREIVQMTLGVEDKAGGFEFGGVKATGWIGRLIKQLEGSSPFEELAVPEGFSGRLRPYQIRGYSWLAFLRQWGLGACLADDMGLGKTIQTLAMVQRDWESNGRGPVLLVCPTSVVRNWEKESARFTPQLSIMVHHGMSRKKGKTFKKEAQAHAMVISTYALVQRDLEFLKEVPWAGAVLDEAQNIKNPETKQAQAARSLKTEYRIALTGTPVENNVGDLWSIMEFLNQGFLGTQSAFKRNFFIPIQAERDPDAANRLKRITGPFILRRLKTDKTIISDLPEKTEMKVFCQLTREQASLYAAVLKDVEDSLNSSEGIQRKGVILATLSKLKQVCNHPAQFLGDNSSITERSGKLTRLQEMLEEIMELKDRALIFSQFAEMGAILRRYIQEIFGMEVYFLHGAVPRRKRDRMIESFQSDDRSPPVFILSLKAGGTGLNLTRANHVFHFDRWWNPAVENQATDRAFRIGQRKNVLVHKFICVGTLEERIDEMIERKKLIAQKVVGTSEGWLTEFSNDELREIFALRKEAI